jgi:hypothetical protein
MPGLRQDHSTGNPRSNAKRTTRFNNGFLVCVPDLIAWTMRGPFNALALRSWYGDKLPVSRIAPGIRLVVFRG